MRQTNAVIESTGGVAGISADHLSDLSGRLSELAAVDDEVIQSAGNVMLTFKNIKAEGGIFDDAMASALDMSAALDMGLQGSVLAISKALNDPAEGLSRLTRMGVTFTDQQKSQIEAMAAFGDVAGAQRIILDELATEFGGAAEANATASQRMTVAFDNIKESLGTALLPIIGDVSLALADFAEWFTALPSSVQTVTVGVIGLTVAFAALYAVMGGPVTIAVAALAVTGATIYGIWQLTQPLRDLFFEVVGILGDWWAKAQPIRDVMRQVGTEAMAGLRAALAWVVQALNIWWAASAPVRGVLNVIGSIGLYALRSAIGNVITLMRASWAASTPLRTVLSFIGGIAMNALRSAISAVAAQVRSAWSATTPLRAALQVVGGMTLSALRSAASAVASAFQRVGSILDSIASKIRNLPTPSDLLSSLPGFASGTESAPRGVAWVGERGPELVNFRGGEKVYTNSRSMAMAAGSGGGQTVVNVYLDKKLVGRAITGAQRADARAYSGAGGSSY